MSEPSGQKGLPRPSQDNNPFADTRASQAAPVKSVTATKKEEAKKVKVKRGTIFIIAAAVLVPTAIAIGSQSPTWNQPEETLNYTTVDGSDKLPESKFAGFYEDDKGIVRYPVAVKPFQLAIYDDESYNGDQFKELRSFYSTKELGEASHNLPNQEAGYTSDPAKKKLDNGTPNPVYVSATDQDYQNSAIASIERLINPAFGAWVGQTYPYADSVQVDLFSDMFTPRYMSKANTEDTKSWLPIYGDWNNDNYGKMNLLDSPAPRWMGQVKSSKSTFVFDKNSGSYVANVTVNVTYSAWDKSEKTIKKNGVLNLKFVVNPDPNADTLHKFLIDSASLKVS